MAREAKEEKMRITTDETRILIEQTYAVQDIGVGHICIMLDGKCLTSEQAEAAADWLNRRAEIESQLAQLKKQAEAWEAVKRYKLKITHLQNTVQVYSWIDNKSEFGPDVVETVLALASQL